MQALCKHGALSGAGHVRPCRQAAPAAPALAVRHHRTWLLPLRAAKKSDASKPDELPTADNAKDAKKPPAAPSAANALDRTGEAATSIGNTLTNEAADVQATLGTSAADVQATLETSAADVQATLETSAADVQASLETSAADVQVSLEASAGELTAAADEAADAVKGQVQGAIKAGTSAAQDVLHTAKDVLGTDSGPVPVVAPGSAPDARFGGRTVLVAGATGGVGRQVVAVLREKGVPVRALIRDPERAQKLLPSQGEGFELFEGDVYQYSTLPPAFDKATDLIICTGASGFKNLLAPFEVDYQGTVNLVALARQKGIKHVVLVTSIGTDDLLNPLNLYGGVLFWKKRAEEELQRSGLKYTIIRPGGLKNRLRPGESKGNVVLAKAGYYGFPPVKTAGSILRRQVAELCVEALVQPAAANKVVEAIAEEDMPPRDAAELFSSVRI